MKNSDSKGTKKKIFICQFLAFTIAFLVERGAQRNLGPFRAGSSELSGDLRQGTCRPLPERRISLIYGRVLQSCFYSAEALAVSSPGFSDFGA